MSDSILMETWLSLFGERRGMIIGRSWATRIFAIAFAFFSVVIMAACALLLQLVPAATVRIGTGWLRCSAQQRACR